MAAARRGKKKVVVKVELGWGGLGSLAVVAFCIFLWMFLLGIWAGQSILATEVERERATAATAALSDPFAKGPAADRPSSRMKI